MSKKEVTTHITEGHRITMDRLDVALGIPGKVALFSCFFDGKPAVALVLVNRDGEYTDLHPIGLMFGGDGDPLKNLLTDHDGESPSNCGVH
jgi:hypothetical protein